MRLVSFVRASCSPARVLLGAWLALIALATVSDPLAAQSSSAVHPIPSPHVLGVARQGTVTIDGALDEAAWSAATPATNFTQQDPHEGQPATQRTEVRFLYDADALYIGARMFDSLGARGIRTQLTRRDQQDDGDYLTFVFDTYHDHIGRTFFQVNPSGVKFDAGQNSPNADPAWDPVWEVATKVDAQGWTAEFRIPFSQLRFSRDSVQTWGMQIWRLVSRLNEVSMWSPWKKEESGGPSRFGHLEDLRVAEGKRTIELLPYVVGSMANARPSDPRDPFLHTTVNDYRIGGDVKALLGSNLTLDATFNPDFGQVEVDPAVVNLSAFETFFPEKRPFFVAGSGLFSFGGLNCFSCSNISSLSLFYSRRIGRQPQGTTGGTFADVPNTSTILGAAKVTGRTRSGFSIGMLDAVTRREVASVIDTNVSPDVRYQREVEPLTNYFVGRVKRDLRHGNLTLGGILTSVDRRIQEPTLEQRIPAHAEGAGIDFESYWKNRTYSLIGAFAGSRVAGDSNAVLRLERSSARYFQRPDRRANAHFDNPLDSSLTTMVGLGGYMRFAKDAGQWLWDAQASTRTPGFEVNDIAFLQQADFVWLNGNVVRQWTNPISIFRNVFAGFGGQRRSNYDGDLNEAQVQAYTGGQFLNYWNYQLFSLIRPSAFDDRATRGGPVVRTHGFTYFEAQLSTDSRKRIVLSTFPNFVKGTEGPSDYNLNLTVVLKPKDNIRLSFTPSYDLSHSNQQFVDAFDDPSATAMYGRRAIFANLTQRTVSMDTRAAITFTPTLTFELFTQPFISTGDYFNFKEFVRPRTLDRHVFTPGTEIVATTDSRGVVDYYTITPTGSTVSYDLGNPDFNFRSLRGNAVLRWEYRPGSTFYLVWTQQRTSDDNLGTFDLQQERRALFRTNPANTVLLKVNYWLTI